MKTRIDVKQMMDLPKTWRRRILGTGLTIKEFCNKLDIDQRTLRSQALKIVTAYEIETYLQQLEAQDEILR